MSIDLTWNTLGEPYAYRVATRYEIPCRVRVSVSVGGERSRAARRRTARPLVGHTRLVVGGVDVVGGAPAGRHALARRRVPPARDTPHRRRLSAAPGGRRRRARRRLRLRDGCSRRADHERRDRLGELDARARSRSRSAPSGYRLPTAGCPQFPRAMCRSPPATAARAWPGSSGTATPRSPERGARRIGTVPGPIPAPVRSGW